MAKKRLGNQKPRIDHYNNGDVWLAVKTIELLEKYDLHLLPWQKRSCTAGWQLLKMMRGNGFGRTLTLGLACHAKTVKLSYLSQELSAA